jgi:arabinofuranan 3-O-arabinosyltransferase
MLLLEAFSLTSDTGVLAIKIDFRVFWAAGKLAVAGDPLAVHDLARLSAAHATFVDEYMPWLYPPGFLVLVTPLGTLSFAMAYLVWTLLSLVLLAWAFRTFVAGVGALWVLVSLAPATYSAIFTGQVSLFWMAGFLAAIAALRDGRWVLAGIFLGCLTLKPQLGLLIPLALLGMMAWRTILAAGVTTLFVHLLPTLYYGMEYWPLLRATLAGLREWVYSSPGDILLMIGPLFMFSFFGASETLAWMAHWTIAIGAAVAVLLLWRSDRIGFDTKVAGLVCAMLLSTPYLWYYDGALMVAVALFLLRGGVLSLRLPDLLLLVPLWIGSGLLALNVFVNLVDQRWLDAVWVTPFW